MGKYTRFERGDLVKVVGQKKAYIIYNIEYKPVNTLYGVMEATRKFDIAKLTYVPRENLKLWT